MSVAILGCRSSRRREPIVGPIPPANAHVERGNVVFMQHCNMCHPGGEGGFGPALNNKPAPGFLIKTQVRAGLGVMPAFPASTIPPDQLDDLIQYLLGLRKYSRPAPEPGAEAAIR
ncbi:MAG TPA: cytochrome c [Bacillota bacterium]|nr:cytochrome c [Bacillota bacterium]